MRPSPVWAESRRRCGRVPAPMWAEYRRRCGLSPGADVGERACVQLANSMGMALGGMFGLRLNGSQVAPVDYWRRKGSAVYEVGVHAMHARWHE